MQAMGTFKKRQKDSFGTWQDIEVPVISILSLNNVRGRVTGANWAVDYETPSTLGKTGKQINTEYFWKKIDAQKWIKSFH